MVENFTAPALASALRDREDLLVKCASLASDKSRIGDLVELLKPFMNDSPHTPHMSTMGVKPDPDQILPEELNSQQLSLFRKRLSRLPREVASAFMAKRAAIVLPLCHDENGEPAMIFTRRSLMLRSHRGEICFPGGMVDDTDDSVVDTALRELHEELGIVRDKVHVLGILRCDWGEIQSITGVAVTPIVAFIGDLRTLDFDFDEGEVDDVFSVPLATIARRTKWRTQDHNAPVFVGAGEDRVCSASTNRSRPRRLLLSRTFERADVGHLGSHSIRTRPVSASRSVPPSR